MRQSRLRKKSPVFRQGYHTGLQEGETMGTRFDKDHASSEVYHSTWNDGYEAGYDQGRADAEREADKQKTDLTLAGLIIMAIIAGAVGFGIGIAVGAT